MDDLGEKRRVGLFIPINSSFSLRKPRLETYTPLHRQPFLEPKMKTWKTQGGWRFRRESIEEREGNDSMRIIKCEQPLMAQ